MTVEYLTRTFDLSIDHNTNLSNRNQLFQSILDELNDHDLISVNNQYTNHFDERTGIHAQVLTPEIDRIQIEEFRVFITKKHQTKI